MIACHEAILLFISTEFYFVLPAIFFFSCFLIAIGNDCTPNGSTEADKRNAVMAASFPTQEITTQPAKEAYEAILRNVGASFKRDTLDKRIINDVKNRTSRFIDVQGGFPHGTAYGLTVNAWPNLQSLPAPMDTDKDGMPDEWEKKVGLNENDASDASKISLHSFYTNIEVYINSLLK